MTYIDFPKLSTEFLIRRLEPPTGKVKWYWIPIPTMKWTISSALAYALRSEDRIDLEAVYAASLL